MKVIVLCGIPGAGKSTLCSNFPTYSRINQDELGSRKACIEEFHKLAHQGKDIIIDRTNFSKEQRAIWTDLARHHNAEVVTCIYLHIDEEEAVCRILSRKNHPTIKEDMDTDRKRAIVYKFNEELEVPDMSENFDSVVMIRG